MDLADASDPALADVTAVIEALVRLARNDGIPCLDFIDVKVVLDNGQAPQQAHFGTGTACGPDRARRAAEAALRDLRAHLAATGAADALAQRSCQADRERLASRVGIG